MEVSKSQNDLIADARVLTQKQVEALERIKPSEKHLPADWKFDRDKANLR